MRCYVKARRAAANLPLPGGVTFARRALTRTLTGNPVQRVCLGGVRPAEWSRNEDGTRQGFGRVAAEWMRNSAGGTVLTLQAAGSPQPGQPRPKVGAGDTATAGEASQWRSLWRGSASDAVAACKPQAGEQPCRWPAQWRSGGGAAGTAVSEGTEAVARPYRATAWWSP